jgi:hypothetical protein
MGKKDLRIFAISGLRVHGRTIHGVAARRIPAVCPIEGPIGEVEVQIDWLRQFFIEKLNVFAIRRRLTWWDLDVRPKDRPSPTLSAPF